VSRASPRRYRPCVSDTGVVDPIRIPAWLREPAERWWREMPPLARLFAGLALLDILGRSIGLLAPAIDWGSLTPLSFVTAFVPHDLWILLPALLLVRRPDSETAIPWVFGGALVVAIVEVVRGPVVTVLAGTSGATTASVLVDAVAGIGLAVAWLMLGRGLAALTPRDRSETVDRLANLAAGALGLLAAVDLADLLVAQAIDLGDPALNQAMTLDSLTGPVQVLGWAYLLWVVIHGLGDARRPRIATAIAGAGAVMAAFIVPVFTVASRVLAAIGVDPSGGSGFGEVFLIIGWLGYVVGPSLVAIAFALGVAAPTSPYVAPAAPAVPAKTTEPEPEAPAAS
jgi:hypothetical protein